MTQQPADGGRPLPEDIADLVCCWVIDFLNVNGLEYWEEGPCVASMYKRMAPFLTHQAKSDAALAAAAEQLRAVMDALKESQAENARLEEIIASYSRASILNRKQLSQANQDAGRWQGQAETWQQRAEISEAQLIRIGADRE